MSIAFLKTAPIRAPPMVSARVRLDCHREKTHRLRSVVAMVDSSHRDDHLAFCASSFDVGQSLFGRFEWKDAIDHEVDGPSIDKSTDLAQLLAVCPHEEEGVTDVQALCSLP